MKQYLLRYRIGRRLNEGFKNYALVSADSKEEAEDKLIKELDKLEKSFQREINYKLYTFKKFKKEIKEKP